MFLASQGQLFGDHHVWRKWKWRYSGWRRRRRRGFKSHPPHQYSIPWIQYFSSQSATVNRIGCRRKGV